MKHRKILLLTHPRSKATALELFFESLNYNCYCNLFDNNFYFDKNDKIILNSPCFVRCSAYTLYKLSNNFKLNFYNLFDTILIYYRMPKVSISSQLKILNNIPKIELGYTRLFEEKRFLKQNNIAYHLVKESVIFNDTDHVFWKTFSPNLNPTNIKWSKGFRARWGLWPEWKTEIANSECLIFNTKKQCLN